MAAKMVLLRGLPGSGKSTFAKKTMVGAVVLSSDDFFVDEQTGEYNWNQVRLPLELCAYARECWRFLHPTELYWLASTHRNSNATHYPHNMTSRRELASRALSSLSVLVAVWAVLSSPRLSYSCLTRCILAA
jgi:hypothetical protein